LFSLELASSAAIKVNLPPRKDAFHYLVLFAAGLLTLTAFSVFIYAGTLHKKNQHATNEPLILDVKKSVWDHSEMTKDIIISPILSTDV
jgi:hypothetical protein